jgi:aconitase B
VLGGVQAGGDVVSSVTVGILYVAFSPAVAFAYAAGWMAISLITSSWLIVSRTAGSSVRGQP